MTESQIQARGRMAILMDSIKTTARERDNLLRPLRDRVNRALPIDRFPPDLPNVLDVQATNEELQAVARVETRLGEAVTEYNSLATSINQPILKRGD